jgi:SAM-dependent methyltransferase
MPPRNDAEDRRESNQRAAKVLSSCTGFPPGFCLALIRYLFKDIPVNVALTTLCMSASKPGDIKRLLTEAERLWGELPELLALQNLLRERPHAYRLVKGILEAVDHDRLATPESCASAFDRAAALSPEGSVALYSLGSPALLAETTAEIVGAMREWGLLGADKTALEIGCGNGRFLEALAPSLRQITGIDVSAAMIAAARRRCRNLSNVVARETGGRDLAAFGGASFDLIFAADSFPYIERCGADLTERHCAEAARVLKPAGHFLIFNYSYRGDPAFDRAEVARLAAMTGFTVLRDGTRDFRLWDGVSFLLGKASA